MKYSIFKRIYIMVSYYTEYFFQLILASYLAAVRKDDYNISEDGLNKIKEIAECAYDSDEIYVYNECPTVKDLVDRINCAGSGQLYLFQGDDWYLLIIRYYTHFVIYDFAAKNRKNHSVVKIFRSVRKTVGNRPIEMVCRESTSYPLVKVMEKYGRIKILHSENKIINGETCYFLRIKIIKSAIF